MSPFSAFAAPGRFWKGNLHTHSNLSDGALDPAEVCRRYQAAGYDFMALTDHFVGLWNYPLVDTRGWRTEGFTTLIGAELHAGAMENGEMWHILSVGLPLDFAPPDTPDFRPQAGQESGPMLAARAAAAGAFVAIAHPQWSALTLRDARSLVAAHAVEVYNHGCRAGADRGCGLGIADLLLAEGRKISLIATDDAHFTEPDQFGGWVMVRAEENTPEALLAALKAGAFYSSTGPEIHDLQIDGDRLHVACSPCDTVILQGTGTAAVAVHGEGMTQAEVPLARVARSPWLRVTVRDANGARAWSNPLFR